MEFAKAPYYSQLVGRALGNLPHAFEGMLMCEKPTLKVKTLSHGKLPCALTTELVKGFSFRKYPLSNHWIMCAIQDTTTLERLQWLIPELHLHLLRCKGPVLEVRLLLKPVFGTTYLRIGSTVVILCAGPKADS